MSTLDNPIMEDKVTPGSVAMRYGLIGGLILVALGLITQITGLVDLSNLQSGTNRIINVLNYVIMIGVIVYAVKAFKEGNGGIASFGSAFKTGFLTMLIVGVILMIWSFVYFGLIDPTLIDTIKEATIDQMVNQRGMDEDQAEQALSFMSWMYNPTGMAIMAGVGTIFMGTIFSLIVAAIMKKNPPESVV